jgi:cysteine desulfurase family protein (TIGR01976 family)
VVDRNDVGMPYDVAAVRKHFPALAEGIAHFDSPGGSQTPISVADAIAGTLTSSIANRGVVTAAEHRAEEAVTEGRAAVADLLGADPDGVIFGRSMTQLTFDMARTLAKDWGPGDEVVVSRLDHDANIRPWVRAAATAGATVRWAGFDPSTGELPVESVTAELSDRTRLVAVTGASNLFGTRPDLPAISAAAHAAGALVYVDGVHLTPHAVVDVVAFGADFYACSPYKFLGPHLGILAAAPTLLETLRPDKLLPSADTVPDRFELGTLPYELLAGTAAAVEFLAALAPSNGSRRERLVRSLTALEGHERALLARLESGLEQIPGVTRHSRAPVRTPLVLFSIDGVSPGDAYRDLAAAGINAPAGTFYAIEASRWAGLGESGAIRAGLAPYTDADDIDRLLAAVFTLSPGA